MKKLKSIREIDAFPLYDITVANDHCFELFNNIIAHNSLFPRDIVSGGCVAPDTLVKMASGVLQPISSINVGDLVDTFEGPKEVTHVWDHETLLDGTPECYEVTFDDGTSIVCSENHRFLSEHEQWIEAKDIIIGMNFLTKTT